MNTNCTVCNIIAFRMDVVKNMKVVPWRPKRWCPNQTLLNYSSLCWFWSDFCYLASENICSRWACLCLSSSRSRSEQNHVTDWDCVNPTPTAAPTTFTHETDMWHWFFLNVIKRWIVIWLPKMNKNTEGNWHFASSNTSTYYRNFNSLLKSI